MLFRSIALIVLVAFMNLIFIDCSGKVTVKSPPTEITGKEKIKAAILLSGNVISFDRIGAKFIKHKKARVVGRTLDGRRAQLSIDRIKEYRISSPKFYGINNSKGKRISELVTRDEKLIMFNQDGAYYDDTDDLMRGTTVEGNQFAEKGKNISLVRFSVPRTISKSELSSGQFIAEVLTDGNQIIRFDTYGGKFFEAHSAVSGFTKEGEYLELDPDNILYVRIERTDAGRIIVGIFGGLLLVVGFLFLIIALTKESCPFVYSYNGEQYVFDAEPLGGAICAGLTKTDFSRLENLKPVNDEYQLMFRNEVQEIQHIDQVKLVYIDHSPGIKIIPDLEGGFHSVSTPQLPLSSANEDGLDLTNFIRQSDGIFWQTKLPTDDGYKAEPLRHQLRFTFSKPPEVKKAKLIINAGTALWGSNMIREMLQLRGDKVDDWYTKINNQGPELFELYHFMEREELYSLKILVRNGDEWIQKGVIPGGGPLVTEDHVIPINLSDISGNEFEIQLNPPKGFWTLDYIAISYESADSWQAKEITVNKVLNHDGRDVTASLLGEDNTYYDMPEVGDWAKFYFTAPSLNDGLERSVYLQTTGYYEIQIDKTKPERTLLIRELIETPGLIVDYSLSEFLKWNSKMASAK